MHAKNIVKQLCVKTLAAKVSHIAIEPAQTAAKPL